MFADRVRRYCSSILTQLQPPPELQNKVSSAAVRKRNLSNPKYANQTGIDSATRTPLSTVTEKRRTRKITAAVEIHDLRIDAAEFQQAFGSSLNRRGGVAVSRTTKVLAMDDTQVDDTQSNEEDLYKLYQINKPSPRKPPAQALILHDEATDEATARTYATNDTGHVDLLGDLEEEDVIQGEVLDEEGSADELAGPETQGTLNFTSPARLSPVTPGYAVRRRVVSPTSHERTPVQDLAALFNIKSNGGLLGPSQLFAQTQGTGSTPPTVAKSDPIYERPSPDFNGAPRPSQQAALSSPVMFRGGSGRRSATEPRGDYVSLIESQERRALQGGENGTFSSDSDGEDDLDEDSLQRRVQRRRNRAKLKERALSDLAGFLPPISTRKTSVRKTSPLPRFMRSLTTPVHIVKSRDVIVLSDNPSHMDHGESDVELADEYDELSQQIIPSERGEGSSSIKKPRTESQLRFDDIRVSHSPSPARSNGAEEEEKEEQLDLPEFPTTNHARLNPPISGKTETVAVANSQPEKASNISSVPSRLILPSSIDSRQFVSQSQSVLANSKPQLLETPQIDSVHSSSLPQVPPLQSSSLPSAGRILERAEADGMDISSSPPAPAQPSTREKAEREVSEDAQPALRMSQPFKPTNDPWAEPTSSAKPQLVNSQHSPASTYVPRPTRRRITYAVPDTSPMATPESKEAQVETGKVSLRPESVTLKPAAERTTLSSTKTSSTGTNSNAIFETAQTHQASSPEKSPQHKPQESPGGPQFSRMGDLAGPYHSTDPTDHIDVNLNILDDDDLELFAALSSPARPTKKRKVVTYGRPLRESMKVVITIPSLPLPETDSHKVKLAKSPRKVHVDSPMSSPLTSQPGTSRLPSPEKNVEPPQVMLAPTTATAQRVTRREIAETPQALLPKSLAIAKSTPLPRPPRQAKPSPKVKKGARAEMLRATLPVETPRPLDVSSKDQVEEIRAPRRVFARFMGNQMAYYPASCLGFSSASSSALKVRFDDGTEIDVQAQQVKALDLREGDLVKVDLDKMRKDIYVVRGLKELMEKTIMNSSKHVKTDIKGYQTVLLEAKTRTSLPTQNISEPPHIIEVPLTSIYITHSLWVHHFKDREYVHPMKSVSVNHRAETPVSVGTAPTTPSSRSRRFTTVSAVMPTGPNGTIAIESKSKLFDNMAFAVTYSNDHENGKDYVSKLIQEHGGRILPHGYDELFIFSASNNTSPMRSPHKAAAVNEPVFSLKTTAAELGFTALIADYYSRRAKYMEALALNIPCLSGKWVIDCCRQQKIIPWDRYLLPAGESAYLDNAVRSRTFDCSQTYDAQDRTSQLQDTIERRPRLLKDKSVMLVMGKRKAEEKRKAYVFLIHALGAKRVEHVKDFAAAKRLLQADTDWDWVYVDDGKVDEARAELLGEKKVGTVKLKSLKRKRGDVLDSASAVNGLKVVGDEFVVQSLIFGALVGE